MVNQKKIFILEDDDALVQALKECFERAGFYVAATQNPNAAVDILKQSRFDFLIVDCLLPQTTGVAFLAKAAKDKIIHPESKIILTSGIYTDRDFIQESIHETKAIGFIKKPINLDELLDIIKKNTNPEATVAVSERKKLYQIFSKEKVSSREKRKLIEALDEVFGFDLPFIYSLLVETQSSGYLNIYGADGSVSGITISKGSITAVDIEDQETYLGSMLIQSGYILPDDLQKVLKDKSNTRKIGEKLIDQNLMSPHALDIVLREQMNIRLSRTIQDTKVKINFVSTETDLTIPFIDSDRLTDYLHDWIASKVSVQWLKAHYLTWLDHGLVISPHFSIDHPLFKLNLIQNLPGLLENVKKGFSVRQLTAVQDYNETALYKALHFFLTKGAFLLGEYVEFKSEQERVKVLKQLLESVTNPQQAEVYKIYFSQSSIFEEDLLQLLGPEPLPTSVELFQFWKNAKDKINAQFNAAKTGKKTEKQDKAKDDFELKIQATKLMEEARNALQVMRFKDAQKSLAKAGELIPEISKLHLYAAWAKIGLLTPGQKGQAIREIELEMMQIPPDEKYEAIYTFVLGLFFKAKGELLHARKNFEKAIAMDPNMIMARRELNIVGRDQAKEKQDIFTMDLKDVVSGFFKKK